MIVKELWPGSVEPVTASLTGGDGQDISAFAAEVTVLPAGKEPADADWLTPTAVTHPSASVVAASFTLDEETLPRTVRVFNVWIRAYLGTAEIIPRVAAQLKRARI